jgi:Uma2 family endonuclease
MATTVERPRAATEVVPDQRIVLRGVSWSTYEALLADHMDRRSPHFAYDRGELEIVAPSTEHERDNWALQRFVEATALALKIEFDNVGINTFKRPDIKVGFEADASYYLQNEPLIRDRQQIDLMVDPPPDLVIEVDVTHGSLGNSSPSMCSNGVPIERSSQAPRCLP